MNNHRSRLNGTPPDARFTNIALEVRAAGYDPVLFGYTDASPDPRVLAPDDPRLRSYEGVLPGFRAGGVSPDPRGRGGEGLGACGSDFPRDARKRNEPISIEPGAPVAY